MSKTSSKGAGNTMRRRFLKRFGQSTAGFGALVTGLVPEVFGQTTPMAALPPPVTTPPLPTTMPPPMPLPSSTISAIDTHAISDAMAGRLVTTLGSGLSMGPAQYSYDAGAQGNAIAMPVTTGSGETVGYLFYGTSAGTTPTGQRVEIPIRVVLSATGEVRSIADGSIISIPPQQQDAVTVLHASFFPMQFAEARAKAADQVRPATRRTPTYSEYRQCCRQYSACQNAIAFPGSMGIFMGLACIVCVGLSTATTGGALLVACATPCASFLACIMAVVVLMASCRSQYDDCMS